MFYQVLEMSPELDKKYPERNIRGNESDSISRPQLEFLIRRSEGLYYPQTKMAGCYLHPDLALRRYTTESAIRALVDSQEVGGGFFTARIVTCFREARFNGEWTIGTDDP